MNTHILIPIENIKDTIKSYKKDIDTSERGGDNIRAAAFTHMIDGLEKAIKLGKEISLDEKNTIDVLKISLDAVAEAMVTMDKMNNSMDKTEKLFWTAGHTVGYKQALLDILK